MYHLQETVHEIICDDLSANQSGDGCWQEHKKHLL